MCLYKNPSVNNTHIASADLDMVPAILSAKSNYVYMSTETPTTKWSTNYSDYEFSDFNISVVVRLRSGYKFMRDIACSEYILKVIRDGYVLPIPHIPLSVTLHNNRSSQHNPVFVRSAIDDLISSGTVIEPTSKPLVINPVTVADRNGKLRLVLDLRYLNKLIWS